MDTPIATATDPDTADADRRAKAAARPAVRRGPGGHRLHARRRGRGPLPGRAAGRRLASTGPPSWRSGRGAASRASTSAPPPRRPGRSLFSLDHHHGSEENQAGWEHHDTHAGRPGHRGASTPFPTGGAPSIGAGLEAVGGRHRRRLAHRLVPLVDTAGLLLHRRRPRRGAGVGRLPGLGAEGGGGRMAGHPRRVPRPRRRRPSPLRHLAGGPRLRASSSRTASAAHCGSSGGECVQVEPRRRPLGAGRSSGSIASVQLRTVRPGPGPAWPARPGPRGPAR